MTTQSCISGQSIGTSTNVGNNLFSIAPKTFAATTTAYVVNAQVTNGSTKGQDKGNVIRVWYTSTMRTVTNTDAPTKLGLTARYVDVRPQSSASLIRIVDSSLEPITGSKFHCWVDTPNLTEACTLDVDLVELP